MRSCLVCDDHAMVRSALGGAVRTGWPDAQVASAGDFPGAWSAAAAARPELIICDLTMPGADPLIGISRLQQAVPGVPILVVTGNEDDALLLELFELGIAGFVPKTSSGEIVEAAIRLVLAGGSYLPPRVMALAKASRPPDRADGANYGETCRLTDRQREVLKLLAEGVSNKEIARALRLSPATVKAHVAAILAALGTANRTEAAHRAHMMGLLSR